MSSNGTDACFSLIGTKTCTMYSDFKVFPSKDTFTDLKSFDDYINNASPNSNLFIKYVRDELNCPEYNGEKLEYLQSTFCGFILQASTLDYKCNPQPPLPICKSVARAALDSFEKVGKEVCKSNPAFKPPLYISNYTQSLGIDDPSGKTCSLGLASDISASKSVTSDQSTAQSGAGNKIGGLYFIIGVSVGAVVLLIIVIVSAYICVRRSRKEQPVSQSDHDDNAETMDVIYEYVPNLFDEIHLSVGDQVLVKIKFDDGWAYGMNLVTKKEGSFPLACVAPPDQRHKTQQDTRIKQRASSLYGFPTIGK